MKAPHQAIWLFPLYLFAINIFRSPIAFGVALASERSSGCRHVRAQPAIAERQPWLALFAFIGGLSAATGMVTSRPSRFPQWCAMTW